MKTLFEGTVVDVVPIENGLVFAYISSKDSTTVDVSYKTVTFTDGKITLALRSRYTLSKFGSNDKHFLCHIKNHVTSRCLALSSGKHFILERDGEGKLIDIDGECVWSGELAYRGNAPSGIAVSNRSIWTCFKEASVLTRMNLLTMKEELRIGGGTTSPFDKPVDLFVDDNDIYVCNSGNHSIVKVSLNTYAAEIYRQFDCPVYRFIKNDGYEFAVLDTGIYLLD